MAMRPEKNLASDRIKRVLDAIPGLIPLSRNSPEFIKWHRDTQIAIENTFTDNPKRVEEFRQIRYFSSAIIVGGPSTAGDGAYARGLRRATAVLQSMWDEIQEYWPDGTQTSTEPGQSTPTNPANAKKVFVIHGRDEETKQTVARFLESLGLEPVILQEQPSKGNTIIEKFEEHAQSAGFAVALCTPDDVGALASDRENLKLRMRQNVVFELGYFAGAIGRNRVCALLKGDIETPSDYDGVVYITLDNNDGWKLSLARELSAAGFGIDLNRML